MDQECTLLTENSQTFLFYVAARHAMIKFLTEFTDPHDYSRPRLVMIHMFKAVTGWVEV